MQDFKLDADQKNTLVAKIKHYFDVELDQDIGAFDAEFLIDFFAKEMGVFFYNQAIADSHRLFSEKNEELGYLLQELEQPTR